jgi:hypothetical protein
MRNTRLPTHSPSIAASQIMIQNKTQIQFSPQPVIRIIIIGKRVIIFPLHKQFLYSIAHFVSDI